ncbi:MAG: type II toxin-antitoxin system RelE/ParE family toxin [Chloroflexi bacterium]|nr:type II toxin-antitoxin system RelE/ParE family toxin [Chloroflexota bacterium]
MAQYRLEVKRRAVKELSRISPDIGMRLLQSIESLASDPRPRQSHKLSESESSYRLRVGDYRVLYQVDDEARSVIIFRVGHRREVYR